MRGRRQALFILLVAVVIGAPSARANHEPNLPLAGSWKSSLGGEISFYAAAAVVGEQAVRDHGGGVNSSGNPYRLAACPAGAQYYTGSYTAGTDSGSHAVCGAGGKYYGWYKLDGGRRCCGVFEITVSGTTFQGQDYNDWGGFTKPPGRAWSGTFARHLPNDGTAAEGPSEVSFQWAMPQRFGLDRDGDGLIDYHKTKADITPASWRVQFTIPGCEAVDYAWKVDGETATFAAGPSCSFTHSFPKEKTYRVEVSAGRARYSDDVLVQDWLVVGVGDSLGSGEGNPDIPKNGDDARWQDRLCHRSAGSYQARTARDIETADPKTSVTFLHLACSGAGVTEGIDAPYWGIEGDKPDERKFKYPLASQVSIVDRLVGAREIDAVVVSAGANDMHFGDVLQFCTLWRNCAERKYDDGPALEQVLQGWLRVLPGAYGRLAAALKRVAPAARVYITQYPDELHGPGPGGFCDHLIDPLGPGDLRHDDAAWIYHAFLIPVNRAIAQAARRYGWNLVGGALERFRGHGPCAADSWVVTYQESNDQQGNPKGTMHPNGKGHQEIAKLLRGVLRPDLYPKGKARRPGAPSPAPKPAAPSTPSSPSTNVASAKDAANHVVTIIRVNQLKCGIRAATIEANGKPGDYRVVARITFASGTGTATWKIVGSKLTAVDALAKRIQAGCP